MGNDVRVCIGVGGGGGSLVSFYLPTKCWGDKEQILGRKKKDNWVNSPVYIFSNIHDMRSDIYHET